MSIFTYLVFLLQDQGALDSHNHGISVTETCTAYLNPCDMQLPLAQK